MSENRQREYLAEDPDVKLPAAVKAMAARVEELHRSTYKKDEARNGGVTDGSGEPAGEEGAEQTAVAPVEPAPAAEAAPAAEPVTQTGNAPVEPAQQPTPDEWQRRYASMKGRYDASERMNREMVDRVSQLEETLAMMQVAQTAAPAAPPPPPEKLVSAQEEEAFGAEFLGVVGKKAQEVISPEVTALKQKVNDLQARLNGVVDINIKRTRADMKKALSDAVPNWKELNTDENFLSWLGLQDDYAGTNRHSMLKDAWSKNDAPRVIRFFKGFLSQEATATPQGDDTDKGTAEPNPADTKVPLETFAAPGRAKTSAADLAPAGEKPLFTRAQITSFYAAVAAGKYRGREAEKDKLERQIFEATREGRIR